MRSLIARTRLSRWIFGSVLALTLVACAMPVSDTSAPTDTMPAPVSGEITVLDPRARPAISGGTGAIYFTVLNGMDEDIQLTGVETDVAAAVELHETVNDNGVMRMRHQPDGFPVQAGGNVMLEPGGKHVMLIDLADGLEEGTEFPATLRFDNGTSLEVQVVVQPMAGMNMDSDGMKHGDMEQEDMDQEEMESGESEQESTD